MKKKMAACLLAGLMLLCTAALADGGSGWLNSATRGSLQLASYAGDYNGYVDVDGYGGSQADDSLWVTVISKKATVWSSPSTGSKQLGGEPFGDGLRVAHLGDLGCEPSAQVMQKLERLDLMLIPIGGYYTIDTPEAVRLIERLKPATVVGMHFANEYCRFPISDETEFLRRTQGVRAGSELEILPGGARPSALVMEPAR